MVASVFTPMSTPITGPGRRAGLRFGVWTWKAMNQRPACNNTVALRISPVKRSASRMRTQPTAGT